jgi:omega-6 fatty acid desaturase (delta-12 desaturase)
MTLSKRGRASSSVFRTSDDAQVQRELQHRVAKFQAPVLQLSVTQAFTSIGGFIATCATMYLIADVSYWIVLALAPVAAGFLVRIFIIQHDCGHRAFFRSKRWNDGLGFVCSLFTLTPYASWRRQHAGHHNVWNNLDRRNTGADIYSSCLTVDEFLAMNAWRRLWYRVTRHPIISNIILPPLVFLVLYRTPFDMPSAWRHERLAVLATNLALAALIASLGVFFGFDRLVEVQLPVTVLASIIGVGLFTVQHRSERTVWARQANWNPAEASLEGATYLRLPSILQWFTGNIGLHHVHHLNPRIPNYRLQQCHDAVPVLADVPAMTLWTAFDAMRYVLWDQGQKRMVRFPTSRRESEMP